MTAAFAPTQPSALPYEPPRRRHLHSVPTGLVEDHIAVVPSTSVMRRRQAVALAVAIAMVWLLLQAATTATALFGPAQMPVSSGDPIVHVVQPGESLWSIARAHQPSGDLRGFVDQLAIARGGSDVRPGETIVIWQ